MESEQSKYVLRQLSSGVDSQTLEKQLKLANWTDEQIEEAFKDARAKISLDNSESVLPEHPKHGGFKLGWKLFRLSFSILYKNQSLIYYVLTSALIIFIIWSVVVGTFLFDVSSGNYQLIEQIVDQSNSANELSYDISAIGYAFIALAYLCTVIISIFFTSALTYSALQIFSGNKIGYFNSIGFVSKKISTILTYALIVAVVGYILNLIEDRFKIVGKIVSIIIGSAWKLSTTFTLPLIVDTKIGPFSSIKQSANLLMKNFGATVTGKASMSLLIFILPILILSIFISTSLFGFIGLCIAVILSIMVVAVSSVITSAAQAILDAALYYYAKNNIIPPDFSADLLSDAFTSKNKT